ncbi:MAG: hypothetical protein V1897_01395 [Pseudomonadota bacterium]
MPKRRLERINWDKLERVAIYGSLIMFVLWQSLSIMVPAIEKFFPQQSPLILLATAFLIAIHYLIKIIETTREVEGFVTHTTFTKAFNQMVSNETHISRLSIVAYTSATWLSMSVFPTSR